MDYFSLVVAEGTLFWLFRVHNYLASHASSSNLISYSEWVGEWEEPNIDENVKGLKKIIYLIYVLYTLLYPALSSYAWHISPQLEPPSDIASAADGISVQIPASTCYGRRPVEQMLHQIWEVTPATNILIQIAFFESSLTIIYGH